MVSPLLSPPLTPALRPPCPCEGEADAGHVALSPTSERFLLGLSARHRELMLWGSSLSFHQEGVAGCALGEMQALPAAPPSPPPPALGAGPREVLWVCSCRCCSQRSRLSGRSGARSLASSGDDLSVCLRRAGGALPYATPMLPLAPPNARASRGSPGPCSCVSVAQGPSDSMASLPCSRAITPPAACRPGHRHPVPRRPAT